MTETINLHCTRCQADWQMTVDAGGRYVDANGKPATVACPRCGPGPFVEIVEDFV